MRRKRGGRLKLVAFDMDGVLIDHVSSWAAVHEALGTENAEAVAAFRAGRIDDAEFIRADVRLWLTKAPDFSLEQMEAILRRVPRMGGLAPAISGLREAGFRCVIISGGLRPLAEMLADEVGFDEVRANSVGVGRDGRLGLGSRVEVPLRRKADVLREVQRRMGASPAETASVGDSAFDIGLFTSSAVSVAFNPKDEEVAAAATHTVTTRDLRKGIAPLLDWLGG